MTDTVKNADVFQAMERWAPQTLAYDWDNVGLQVGSFSKPVQKVMITLDVLEPVVDEAVNKQVDLIIAHHPMLFKPLRQLNVDSMEGRIMQKLIQNEISVYAAHTNLDVANGGVNDMLCDIIGINETVALQEESIEKLIKFSVNVPESHTDDVRDAMAAVGAGHIGEYSHCTFQTQGQGTFMPLEGTDPFIGEQNELARVDEVKMETIAPENILNELVQAVVERHPYEEPAYDIYPLENKGKSYGIGRIGTLSADMTVNDLCEHIKDVLDVPCVRVAGELTKSVKTVAVLGGSGEKYAEAALEKGADAYITGDVTFHPAQDAWQMGMAVIDPGHHVEKVMKQVVKSSLDQQFSGKELEIIVSNTNTEPFRFV